MEGYERTKQEEEEEEEEEEEARRELMLLFFLGGDPRWEGGGTGRDTCSLRVACTKALPPKPKSRKEGMIFFSLVRIFFLYWLQGVRSNGFHQLLSLLGIPGESPLVFLLFSLALCSGGGGGGGVAACSKSLFRNALLMHSSLGADGRGNGTCVDRRYCPADIEGGGEATNVSMYFGFSHV